MKFLRLIRWINVLLVLLAIGLGLRFDQMRYSSVEVGAEEAMAYPDDPGATDYGGWNDDGLSEYDRSVIEAYQELTRFSDSLERADSVADFMATLPDSVQEMLANIQFQPDTQKIILETDNAGTDWLALLYLFLSAALVLSGANSVNNALDAGRDSPQKTNPAASGDLTPRLALSVGVFLTLAGLLFAMMLGKSFFLFALIVSIALFLYNKWLRDIPFAGNILVALSGGALFIYIGMYFGLYDRFFAAAIFAFLAHLARELVKDAQDVEDDRAAGGKTVAVLYGADKAMEMAQPLLFVLMLGCILAVIQKIFPPFFLLLSGGLVLPFATRAMLLITKRDPKTASTMIKLTMLGGMIAMGLGV